MRICSTFGTRKEAVVLRLMMNGHCMKSSVRLRSFTSVKPSLKFPTCFAAPSHLPPKSPISTLGTFSLRRIPVHHHHQVLCLNQFRQITTGPSTDENLNDMPVRRPNRHLDAELKDLLSTELPKILAQPRPSLSAPFFQFITKAGQLNRMDMALQLLDTLEGEHHRLITKHFYYTVLTACSKVLCMEHANLAFNIFSRMKSKNIAPGPNHYTALIRACTKEAHAEEVFQAMKDSGILPPPNAYVAMMGMCARNPKAPNTSRIFTLYEELKKNYNMAEIDKADAITLINTIISACAHSTDPDREAKSLIILGEAKKYNLPFTNHTYNSLLYLYIYLHQMDKATAILQRMRTSTVRPTLLNYFTFLHVHKKHQQYDKCFEIYEMIKADGLEMTNDIFRFFFTAAGHWKKPELVEQLSRHMESVGLSKEEADYNVILFAHLSTCQWDQADQLLKEMKEGNFDMKLVSNTLRNQHSRGDASNVQEIRNLQVKYNLAESN